MGVAVGESEALMLRKKMKMKPSLLSNALLNLGAAVVGATVEAEEAGEAVVGENGALIAKSMS